MADKTVLDLDPAGTFNGTETIEVVQSGTSKKQAIGTAAKSNVTTSATDTTAGRITKVGDFGIGGFVTTIENTDADNLTTPGIYGLSSTALHNPTSQLGGTLRGCVVIVGGWGSIRLVQKAISVGISSEAPREFTRFYEGTVWTDWQELWNSGNTTVDGSGFIKEASPIIRLFGDGSIQEPCQKSGAEVTKKSTGVYEITGTLGLSDTGWYIEVPKDRHGAVKVYVEWEQGENKTITVKTYEPTGTGWRPEKGKPMDIPEGRWIDLRFNAPEIAEDVPEENQGDSIITE